MELQKKLGCPDTHDTHSGCAYKPKYVCIQVHKTHKNAVTHQAQKSAYVASTIANTHHPTKI